MCILQKLIPWKFQVWSDSNQLIIHPEQICFNNLSWNFGIWLNCYEFGALGWNSLAWNFCFVYCWVLINWFFGSSIFWGLYFIYLSDIIIFPCRSWLKHFRILHSNTNVTTIYKITCIFVLNEIFLCYTWTYI